MKLARALVSICVLGVVPACTVSVEPIPEPIPEPAPPAEVPPPPTNAAGTITVNWLVSGSSRPSACAQAGASEVEVVVYDTTGAPVTRRLAPCGTFTLTIPLATGTYTADVSLLSGQEQPMSGTKTISALEVVPGTDLAVNLDF
jgi:hypothetical protein